MPKFAKSAFRNTLHPYPLPTSLRSKEALMPDDRAFGSVDKIYTSCLHVLQDFHHYLIIEPELHCLEEEQISAMEQAIENLYLWGCSFHNETLEATLHHLNYLKDSVLDSLCRIGELMTNQCKPLSLIIYL